jgi:hypothetical protein
MVLKSEIFHLQSEKYFHSESTKNSATATIWRLDTSILNSLEMPPKRASGTAGPQ